MERNTELAKVEEVLADAIETTDVTIPKKHELSDREERFIEFYIEDFNKVDAYRRAFSSRALTEDVIKMADDLMLKPVIERKLKAKMAKHLSTKLAAAPHWILSYIQEIMAIDPTDYMEDDGMTIKPLSAIRPELRKFIRPGKITVNNKTGTIYGSYEVPTFTNSLDKLMEIFKLAATLQANAVNNDADATEVIERRNRILNS